MGRGRENIASVILAAGSTPGGSYGFPPNSKPKCLFHVDGEILLERQVRILRDLGIRDIRIVVRYKHNMIDKLIATFNAQHNWNLEVRYSPSEAPLAFMKDLKVGLKGIGGDILISFGDTWITRVGLRIILNHPRDLFAVLGRGGGSFGYQMYKVASRYLPGLRKVKGSRVIWPLHNYCMNHGGVILPVKGIYDVDYYSYTDESKM